MFIRNGFSLLSTLIALTLVSTSGFLYVSSYKSSRDAVSQSFKQIEKKMKSNWLRSLVSTKSACLELEKNQISKVQNLFSSATFKVSDLSGENLGNSQFSISAKIENEKFSLLVDCKKKNTQAVDRDFYFEELLCENLGGELMNQKCRIGEELSETENAGYFHSDCAGKAKTIIQSEACGDRVTIKCEGSDQCRGKQKTVCKVVERGEVFFISKGEQRVVVEPKCPSGPTGPPDPNGGSKGLKNCAPMFTGYCPIDRVCSIAHPGGINPKPDCLAASLVTCELGERKWQCPTYLSNSAAQDSVSRSLIGFPAVFPSVEIKSIAQKIVFGKIYNDDIENEIKEIVCGTTYGACRTYPESKDGL